MEENIQRTEEGEGEKSFAELLEESGMDREWLKPGQRMEAVIVKITLAMVSPRTGATFSSNDSRRWPPSRGRIGSQLSSPQKTLT